MSESLDVVGLECEEAMFYMGSPQKTEFKVR